MTTLPKFKVDLITTTQKINFMGQQFNDTTFKHKTYKTSLIAAQQYVDSHKHLYPSNCQLIIRCFTSNFVPVIVTCTQP
jgi:hypothetical protein